MKPSTSDIISTPPVWLWGMALALAILGVLVQRGLQLYPYDDALIHLRIAQNFVNHGVPYFDVNRPVFATSSLLWTCVLAALLWLDGTATPEALSAMGVLNACCAAAAALVWTHAAHCLVKLSALYKTLLLLSLWCVMLPSSAGLMETPFALLLAGIAIQLILRESSVGWLIAGCLPFVRPEYALLSVLLVCTRYYLAKTFSWKPILLCALGALPWVVLSLGFFRGLVPHTIRAKSLVYWVTPTEFSQLLMRTWMSDAFVAEHRLLAALYFLLGFAGVLALLFRRSSDRLNKPVQLDACVTGIALLGVALAIPAVYAMKHALLFPWYMPLYFVPLILAATLLLEGMMRILGIVYLSIPPLTIAACLAWAGFTGQYGWYPDFASVARVHSLMEYGRELSLQYPGKVLLAPEIGALGLRYQGTLVDGVGLVTPEALAYHPMRIPEERKSGLIGAVPAHFVEAVKPDLILGLSIFLESFANSKFAEEYQLIEKPLLLAEDRNMLRSTERLWQSDTFQLWVRKSLDVGSL